MFGIFSSELHYESPIRQLEDLDGPRFVSFSHISSNVAYLIFGSDAHHRTEGFQIEWAT